MRTYPSRRLVPLTLFMTVMMPLWFYVAINGLLEQRASTHWPKTGAVVTESMAETKWRGLKRFRTLHFRYEYEVAGRMYVGRRLRASTIAFVFAATDADRFSKEHPVGCAIEVAYHPHRPHRSLLEPGVSLGILLPPLTMMVLLLYIIVRLWLELIRRAVTEEDPEVADEY